MSENLSNKQVGLRLRAARELRGYSDQKEFAEAIRASHGVALTAYGEYERGQRNMDGRDRLAFCEVLNVPECWFTASDDVLWGKLQENVLNVQPADIKPTMTEIKKVEDAAAGKREGVKQGRAQRKRAS